MSSVNHLAIDIGQSFFGENHFLTTQGGVGTLVSKITQNMLVAAGVTLIFLIIYGGSQMISAGGDPAAYERAQKVLTAGIVGFILCAGAWLIVKAVEALTGVVVI